jgi:hypothetical protein
MHSVRCLPASPQLPILRYQRGQGEEMRHKTQPWNIKNCKESFKLLSVMIWAWSIYSFLNMNQMELYCISNKQGKGLGFSVVYQVELFFFNYFLFLFFAVLGFELKAYTLSHSTSSNYFVMGFFEIGSWDPILISAS